MDHARLKSCAQRGPHFLPRQKASKSGDQREHAAERAPPTSIPERGLATAVQAISSHREERSSAPSGLAFVEYEEHLVAKSFAELWRDAA